MYAIIDNSGKQVQVCAGQTVEVDRMAADVGAEVSFDRVLLVGGDEVRVGDPLVEGASVRARVLEHFRGPKVTAYMYRRRKRTRVTRGFRAGLTKLEILEIIS